MTRPSRIVLALSLSGLVLGACTARDAARAPAGGPRYASLDATLDGVPRAAAASRPATPIAVLPDWAARATRVIERDDAEAFEQVVALNFAPRAGLPENRILLRASRTRLGAESQGGDVPGGRPSEAGIRAELAASFPGTPMQVVTRPAANTYGPYGLAVGRTAQGARCLYAWQWIEAPPALDLDARGPLSLRLRLCRADITLDAMAAAMDKLRLVPRFAGPVPASDARARPSPRHRAAAARATGGVASVAGGRGAVRAENPGRADGVGWSTAPAGRRYLGVADAAAMPSAVAPAAPEGAPDRAGPVSADLPPEALRGPVPRTGGRP